MIKVYFCYDGDKSTLLSVNCQNLWRDLTIKESFYFFKSLSTIAQTHESDQTFSAVSIMSMMV